MKEGFEKCDSSRFARISLLLSAHCSQTRRAKQLCAGDWVKKTGTGGQEQEHSSSENPPNGVGAGHLWGRWGQQTIAFANACAGQLLEYKGGSFWSQYCHSLVCRVEEELSRRRQFCKRSAGRKIRDSQHHCCFVAVPLT